MTIAPSKDGFRPPLITPSASPQPHSYSGRDAAPPSKRQRMVSASRSSSSRLSVGVTESILDMQQEREASRTRLLDTWSHLAERYSRRLDEDDIVDIRTGEIVKDNGFWRTTRKFNFGEALAPEGTDGRTGDESQAEESSEDEEGVDELDAFPEAPDFLEEIFVKGLQPAPAPSGDRGSSDNNDLQEFLEAEKRRKEDYGSDVEDEDLEPPPNDSVGPTLSPLIANSEFDDEEHSITGDRPATSSSVYESAQEESEPGSEDELDNWEPTEASIVVVASNGQDSPFSEGETDSEVEIVEPSVPQKASQVKKRTPPTQLYTPPLSHSSIDAPNLYQVIPSPNPPSPPHLTADFTPNTTTVEDPRPSGKRKTRNQYSSPRPPTPEIIEISDDDIPALGRTSYSPSPSPPSPPSPPSLPPIVRARSRALSYVPEVVIRTLPPRLAPVKANKPPRKSQPSSPVEITRTKSPVPETPAKTSPVKKSVKKPKTSQKDTEKAAESRGRIQAVRRQSVSRKQSKTPPRGESPSKRPPESSPEIGVQSTAPVPTVGKSVVPRDKPSPKNRTGQKRKRTSSEHENSLLPLVPTTVSKGKTTAKPREVANVQKTRTTRSRRSSSKSRHITPSDHDSQSSSEEDTNYHRHHNTRRFASVSTPSNIQPPYTPHATPSHHPGMYPPIADPRAQQIVTQAMQQLAALLWTPTHSSTPGPMYPFTPTHHRFSSVGPNFMHSTPDHPHPYPYSFDPSMSKATLPPSSPEPPSSPIKPRERRKSLVSRSRSRGRRVSFHVEEEVNGWSESEESESESEPLKATVDRHHSRQRTEDPPKRSRGKGKEKATTRYQAPSSSESEQCGYSDEESRAKPTPATSNRSQTPGPESLPKERASSASVSSTRLRLPKKTSAKHRTGRDGGSRS